jgi:branched-chain amino acid transport system substrate-binding protein
MKRWFVVLFVLGIVVSLIAFYASAIAQDKPKPAPAKAKPSAFAYEDKIGVVKIKPGEPIHIACWMVVAGPDASLGTDTKRGVEIAIGDKGGKILGFPIKLSVQDTGCNAEGGQAAATKLAADPTIVAAIGSNCSSEARPGAPILWKAGIATVSPSNTAPFLTDPKRGPEYDGYLRTAHNDKVQGAVAAEFAIKQLKVKKAATIHDGSPYAEQLQAIFAETFKKMGGTITSQEAVAPTDTDMRPVLTKIATGKPEFIYYPIFIAAGGHITRQAKEVRGLEKVSLMGADGIFSPDFYKAAGETAIGMYHSSPDFSAFAAGYKSFLEKHQKKYGEKPLAPFHAHGYDATLMIFAAIEKVAQKAPDGTLYIGRQKLRDALYATKNLKGLTGTINCDKYGDCADPRIAVYKTTEENVKKLVMPDKPFWTPAAPTPAKKAPAKK